MVRLGTLVPGSRSLCRFVVMPAGFGGMLRVRPGVDGGACAEGAFPEDSASTHVGEGSHDC